MYGVNIFTQYGCSHLRVNLSIGSSSTLESCWLARPSPHPRWEILTPCFPASLPLRTIMGPMMVIPEREGARSFLSPSVRIVTTVAEPHFSKRKWGQSKVKLFSARRQWPLFLTVSQLAGSGRCFLCAGLQDFAARSFALSIVVKPCYSFLKQPNIYFIFFSIL